MPIERMGNVRLMAKSLAMFISRRPSERKDAYAKNGLNDKDVARTRHSGPSPTVRTGRRVCKRFLPLPAASVPAAVNPIEKLSIRASDNEIKT
jgi:hypothetical protein